jgi:DNA-binding NarL/FixJ family response regulator
MIAFAGIGEFERDPIRNAPALAGRRQAGGFTWDVLRSSTPSRQNLVRRLITEGKSVREIADTFNIHTATIFRLSVTAA